MQRTGDAGWIALAVLTVGVVAAAEVFRALRARRDDPWASATDSL